MKRALLLSIIVFMFSSSAFAAPFLVCDPYRATEITGFKLTVNGIAYTVTPQIQGDESRLYFDTAGKWVGGVIKGEVRACNGVLESDPTPFDFRGPSAPSGVGLE